MTLPDCMAIYNELSPETQRDVMYIANLATIEMERRRPRDQQVLGHMSSIELAIKILRWRVRNPRAWEQWLKSRRMV